MIDQEKEPGEPRINFKTLRLITPELAQRLEIPAESPVFISPYIGKTETCPLCGKTYHPLVYQAGALVEAHHFHKEDGGIYFYSLGKPTPTEARRMYQAYITQNHRGPSDSNIIRNSLWSESGWIATLEAATPVYHESDQGRASIVKIEKIRAFCRASRSCQLKEVSEGFVFPNPKSNDELVPLCSLERHPELTPLVRFRFRISADGEVLFSSPK